MGYFAASQEREVFLRARIPPTVVVVSPSLGRFSAVSFGLRAYRLFRLCFTGACPVALVGCTRAVCALSVFEEDGLGKEHPTVGDGLFLASPGPD